MKIELIVGRKYEREIFEVKADEDPNQIAIILLRLSRPYLMSNDIDATWDSNTKTGTVIVGGFRKVGHAKVIEA